MSIEQAQANVDASARRWPKASRPTIAAARLACGRCPKACFRRPFKQQLVLSGTIGMAVVGLVLLDRLRQRCQFAAGARQRSTAGDRGAAVDWRQPRPPDPAVPHRERCCWRWPAASAVCSSPTGPARCSGRYRPPFLQEGVLDLNFDVRVLRFSVAVSLATGILFGLAPALQSSRPDLVTELKERTTADRAARIGTTSATCWSSARWRCRSSRW